MNAMADQVTGPADIDEIFRVLDALLPRYTSEWDENTYRPSLDDWADTTELKNLVPEADTNGFWCEATGDQASVIGEFDQTEPIPVCAVDAGMIRLGETGQETYIALRGNYVVAFQDGQTLPHATLYRSGPLRLPHGGPDQVQALHALGLSLGQADLYVHMDDGNAITVRGGADVVVQILSHQTMQYAGLKRNCSSERLRDNWCNQRLFWIAR